jgi:putative chitobiose transport system permease protein
MNSSNKKKLKDTFVAYMFMLPALILLSIFVFYPMVFSLFLGFFDFNMIRHNPDGTLAAAKYVGMDNFKKVFSDRYFFISLKNSLIYLIIVPIIQLLAIIIALMVNRKMKGVVWFRAAYYIPVVTSIVVVGIAWKWVFASDGILNFILVKNLHLFSKPVLWLADKNIALFSVMFVTLWQGIGYYMMLYLAGLQAIPPEYEEAAIIDGAGRIDVFHKITLPLLKPTVALCSIISCISAIKVFGEIFVMTNGGPEYGTMTMVYYIFMKAFSEFDMGYAAALALILGLFVGMISLINIIFFKEGGLQYY